MTHITAEYAKSIADKKNDQEFKDLKNRIDDSIREACENGDYHVVFHYDLPDKVKFIYRDLGYKVEGSTYRNEVVYTVSWG